jgi:hypothetical protein
MFSFALTHFSLGEKQEQVYAESISESGLN